MDRIDHLTARWAGAEGRTPAAQLRVERLLGMVEYQPAGLPASAVLVIQRLDGLPPLTDLTQLDLRWENAIKQRIHELYRAAARPAVGSAGSVPVFAPAVLFYDAAEMLVCYTRDVLAQRSAWYWRRLFPSALGGPGAQLATAYAAYATAVPAALAALVPSETYAALAHLKPPEIAAIVGALHAAYALPDAVLNIAAPAATAHVLPETAPGIPPPPWSPLPTWAADLTLPAVCLWGLAQTLHQRPALARSTAFAAQAARWRDAVVTHPDTDTTAAHTAVSNVATPEQPATRVSARETPAKPPSDTLSDITAPPASDVTEDAVIGSLWPAGMHTGLGGALFLLHVLDWFDLPPDLNRWDALAALAWALLAEPPTDDALWGLLAGLADRDPDIPLDDITRPADWPLSATGQRWSQAFNVPVMEGAGIDWLGDILPPDMLALPGRIVTSRTHVDLYLPLTAARVDVRRLGLDASPGWLPDLGYVVLFHYVEAL